MKNQFIIKRNFGYLNVQISERFVSSSLLIGSLAQKCLKPFKSLNITNLSHATHDLTENNTD